MREISAGLRREPRRLAHVQGEAAPHDFDPQRYVNWRFFWDYSGGNVFENMVHQVGYWHTVLNLKIPHAVTMTGATTSRRRWIRRT